MSQTWNGTKKEKTERRTYTVEDIAQILGIGRTSAYILVKEGHFKIVRIGNAIRVSKQSFDEWQVVRKRRKTQISKPAIFLSKLVKTVRFLLANIILQRIKISQR